MIERIEGTTAISFVTSSPGRAVARRQRRLKWLSSLREAGSPIEEADTEDVDKVVVVYNRARIADALSTVEEMRGRLGTSDDEPAPEAGNGGTITATELALRIAHAADRSLRVQARLGAASVRRLVYGTR
jgi:hypothetical protein